MHQKIALQLHSSCHAQLLCVAQTFMYSFKIAVNIEDLPSFVLKAQNASSEFSGVCLVFMFLLSQTHPFVKSGNL
jgi:ABC-type uncharacterized transport system permease subunit